METIVEKNYASCVNKLIDAIKSRKVDLSVRNVIVVPDVYAFSVENRVFRTIGGAFDVEVTTFNRLFHREVNSKSRAINRQGAIMLLKKICYETPLACYGSSAKRAGFAEKLYDAINKLRSCSVTPDDLRKASSDKKINDIATLYEKFKIATAGKFVDSAGRITLISQAAKEGAFRNCKFYVALYDVITPEMNELLAKLDEKCLGVTLYATDENINYKLSAKPRVIGCDNAVVQYKEVAKSIKKYMYENASAGARFSDIVVIDESSDYSIMKRIFDEYDIPYYANTKIALTDSELYRFIKSAFNAYRRGFKQEDILNLARNYYLCSGIEREYLVAFVDYVKKKCVNYKGFFSDFDDKSANLVRCVVQGVMEVMSVKATSAKEMSEKIKNLLDFVGAKETTQKLNDKEREITQIDRNLMQIYDKIVEIIELYAELFVTSEDDEEKLFDTLCEGFESCEVSTVPNKTDMVMVAKVSAFRGSEIKRAYVVNFNEGILPKTMSESGLILDSDADKLSKYSVNITPKVEQKNKTVRVELWKTLSVCENLEVYYTDAEGIKPSYDLKQLCAHNEVKEINIHELATDRLKLTDPMEIAYSLGNRADAVETVCTVANIPYAESVRKALGYDELRYTLDDQAIIQGAKDLFFGSGKTSVSALQTYFECPYKFFLRYGLRIKELEDGEVNVLDIGLLLHKFVEIYINEGMPENTDEFVEEILPKVLEKFEKYTYEQNEKMLARLKSEAKKLCAVTRRHITLGQFVPFGAEVSFGKDKADDTVVKGESEETNKKISLEKTITINGVKLTGEIDRIDIRESKGEGDGECNGYARVVDYKTGNTTYSLKDLYYGKKIQLAMYMQIMKVNGYRPAGFFYFPFSVSWKDDETSNRLDGPVNASGDNMLWHDSEWRERYDKEKAEKVAQGNNRSPYVNSLVLALSATESKGKFTNPKSGKILDEEDLDLLCNYAEEITKIAIDEILAGNITPSPLESGKKSSCDYCPYADICGKGVSVRRMKKVEMADIKGAL